jgi:hypothetical protein
MFHAKYTAGVFVLQESTTYIEPALDWTATSFSGAIKLHEGDLEGGRKSVNSEISDD